MTNGGESFLLVKILLFFNGKNQGKHRFFYKKMV